jgi:hypothetical protein
VSVATLRLEGRGIVWYRKGGEEAKVSGDGNEGRHNGNTGSKNRIGHEYFPAPTPHPTVATKCKCLLSPIYSTGT